MGLENSHWERSQSILCLELFTTSVTFHLLCELSDYTVIGYAGSCTDIYHMFFVVTVVFFCLLVCLFVLPGHQHRSIGVRSQDCSNHGSRPTVDAMGQLKC